MDADADADQENQNNSGKWKKNQFKCIVQGCKSSTITNIAKLHSFPWRDMPRAAKWITAVGRLDLLGAPPKALLRLRVCDLHFERGLKRGKNMKLFDNRAVPTLQLGGAPPVPRARRAAPRKGRRRRARRAAPEAPDPEPEPAPEPVSAPSPAATQTPIRVPRELARFLTLREELARRNTARRGYDMQFCVFALDLFLACPGAYRALRRSLRLPPPGLLPRADLRLGTCPPPALLAALRSKLARLPPADRDCTLCLDEVELAPRLFYAVDKDELVGFEEIDGAVRTAPAARALLLVARGLRGAWTQPLGYYYLAEDTDLRLVVPPLLRLLPRVRREAGARVCAVVAALGPTFAGLARALGVRPESPLLPPPAPRVPFLHDPDQLLLTLRDTLRAYDVCHRAPDGGALRARWSDVEALAADDAARPARLLPELTRARLQPVPAQASSVRHAAAVLSRRVAAHLAARPGAEGTARLLRLAAAARRALAAPRAPRDLPRAAAAADALAAALADMHVVAADGAEHAAEVFAGALRVSLAGALQALAARGADDGPLRLARCGLRPVRRFAERAEGVRGRLAPREFRARFRRWAMRCLLSGARAGVRGDELAALLRRAEQAPAPGRDPAPLRVRPLQHTLAAGAGRGALGRAATLLLRECRRAHWCSALAAWAADAARWRRVVRDMERAFTGALAGRAANAPGARALAALAPVLAARLPCACFPRDTLARLFVRFRLRAALLAHNRALRAPPRAAAAPPSPWLLG